MTTLLASLLIASLSANIVLYVHWKIAKNDYRQESKMLTGAIDEKDRLRAIIQQFHKQQKIHKN